MFQRLAISSVLALALIGSAVAQEQPASFTLTVTPADLQVIGKGLSAQPYNDVAALMAKLQAQVIEQQKAKDANGNKAEPVK